MNKYSPDIEPRHLRFTIPPDVPSYWHSQSDIKTYHFTAMAIFLPLLEKLVILSLKKSLPNVPNALKAQVASLIAQEAIHGREFERFRKIIAQRFVINYPYHLKIFRLLAGLINRICPSFHCALSAAGEHFTAITAELFLRDPTWFANVKSEYRAIWRWHCIEEIEHKNVAFDVFQSVNGHYFTRIFAMLWMSSLFFILHFKPIWQMMKQDKKCWHISFYLRAFRYYWGKGGFCRALLKPYLDYFKPSFHPSSHDNQHLITPWKNFFRQASPQDILKALQATHPPA